MPNPHRGEIAAELDGETFTLCLTLGSLAELEARLEVGDLSALAERFESGVLSAGEAIKVIGAGLRGAGHDIADEAVARMRVDGGAAGYVRLVADLLEATFRQGAEAPPAEAGGPDPTGPA